MNVVPDDLAELVHRAAQAAPPYTGDLSGVRRRWRARRRRRNAVLVGGLAALVALTGGAVPLLHRGATAPVAAPSVVPATAPSSALPTAPAPAQRLTIIGPPHTWRIGDSGPEVGLDGVAGEVRPDGSVVRLRMPAGFTDFEPAVALPDGRLVGTARIDLMPGVERKDGPDAEGLSIKVVVVRPDGSVERQREVRIKGQDVHLAGADARHAYLLRPVGIVSLDLGTGAEKILLRASQVGEAMRAVNGLLATDVRVDGRWATVRLDATTRDCTFGVYDLTTGKRRSLVTTGARCQVRLSPAGDRLAAVHARELGSRRTEYRLAIHDVVTGAVLAEQPVAVLDRTDRNRWGSVYGVAWDDDRTVRAVWAHAPDGKRVYQVPEVMRIVTATAQ